MSGCFRTWKGIGLLALLDEEEIDWLMSRASDRRDVLESRLVLIVLPPDDISFPRFRCGGE